MRASYACPLLPSPPWSSSPRSSATTPATALIVVDVQNDFADPAGSLSVAGGDVGHPGHQRGDRGGRRGRGARRRDPGLAPGVTPHFAKDGGIWPVHCVAGTWGADAPPGPRRSRLMPRASTRASTARTATPASRCVTRRPATSAPTDLDGLLRAAGVDARRRRRPGDRLLRQGDRARRGAPRLRDDLLLTDACAAVDLTPGDGERAIAEMAAAGVRVHAVGLRVTPVIGGLVRLGLGWRLTVGWIAATRCCATACDGPPPPIASLIVIDAPIERVWAELADIEGQPRWMPEMKAVRLLTPAPVGVGTRGEATVRILGHGGDRPGRDHRVRAADPLRDPPRGHLHRRRRDHPGARRGRHDDDRPLGRDARRPGHAPPVGHRSPRPSCGSIFQADLERLRDLRRTPARRPERGRWTSTSSTRPTSCSARTTRRGRRSSGATGVVLSGVSGLCDQLLYLLREEGATHVGCATDRVIESFRNDLFPGYKSSAGMPPELLDQFPIAEAAVEALGIVLWPMVEYEADDAIAAAAVRFADDPARRAHPRVHAGQGHGPARPRRADRPVGSAPGDRLRRCRGPREVGRRPAVDPGLAGRRRRLVGRLPGHPGLGRQGRGGGPGALRPPRGRPGQGVGPGRSRVSVVAGR